MTHIGNILVKEGIDHTQFVREFLDATKRDSNGNPIEVRASIDRDTYIELHVIPNSMLKLNV